MITVDMLMVGFKFFVARLDAIAVSRGKKMDKEKENISKAKEKIAKHDIERRRARAGAKKMSEFIS